MIEARIYALVNGNNRTFVGRGKDSNEADRNARRRLHIYMESNGDTASFEDNRVEILDTTFLDERKHLTTLAESILNLPDSVPALA